MTTGCQIRPAKSSDLEELVRIEQLCFNSDVLSKRSFKRWISNPLALLLVVETDDHKLLGYALALLPRATRHSRLYSIAIDPNAQGKGLSRLLLKHAEDGALSKNKLYMRLEVAEDNHKALALYQSEGYLRFGFLEKYYEDGRNALRLQKRIRHIDLNTLTRNVPWYPQSTRFSSGAASLLMAMADISNNTQHLNRQEEFLIWRESTVTFMISNHGDGHPIGLGLAAQKRGFKTEVYLTSKSPWSMDDIHDLDKKSMATLLDLHFRKAAKLSNMKLHHKEITQMDLEKWFKKGCAVVILTNTQADSKKASHWAVLSGIDEHCFYLHNPCPQEHETKTDCSYLAFYKNDFQNSSSHRTPRLRTAIVIYPDH